MNINLHLFARIFIYLVCRSVLQESNGCTEIGISNADDFFFSFLFHEILLFLIVINVIPKNEVNVVLSC